MQQRLVILNPVAKTRHAGGALAPRLADVRGRTIGLLDDGHTTAGDYLRGIGALLGLRGAEVRYWRKPLLSRPSPVSLLDEIAQSCDAVVVGVAA